MDEQGSLAGSDERDVQQVADRLALALEDVGFDVGRAFPMLTSGSGPDGVGFVQLGRVTRGVASDLASVLSRAAGRGVSL
ncbi:hypothetical protein [Allorhizocola rhizosphaerae]|uniref:hypothetical protein n=1 Tax=Allorhizocola rhizosphaerae TaxID=1872709 RepID=UPI000E3EDDE0|nr:hypothetical protein [Allorhizocola rhizosphaerae]